MRHARLKPASQDTWHHCYNRAVGNRNDRPFNRVGNAADYRFCSYGRWRQSGRHPFAAALDAHLIPSLPAPFQTMSPLAIRKEMARSLTDCDTEASTRPRGPIRTRCARAPQCDRRGLTPPGSPGCNYPQNRSVR